MGSRTRITCSITPDEGDKFMMIKQKMTVKVEGVIDEYSDYNGLTLNPCKITY